MVARKLLLRVVISRLERKPPSGNTMLGSAKGSLGSLYKLLLLSRMKEFDISR